MVSVRHPLFEAESLSVDIEESVKRGALGAKDWTLRVSSGYSRFEGISGGIEPELSEEYANSLSMERSIWSTGGRVKAEINSGLTKSDFDASIPFSLGPSEIYESRGTLSYSQPLLKNRGGTLDRLGFDLAKYSVDIAKLQTIENQEDFTLSVALKFMDWVLLTEKRKIAKRRLALAGEQLSEITKRRKANLVDEIDRLRAVDSKEIARANLHLVEANWKALRAKLAILAASDSLYGYEPDFDIYDTEIPDRLDREALELLEGSRVIGAFERRIARLERERTALLSGRKPYLSLDASVSAKGAGDSISTSVAADGTDASLSMNFAYPLGNTSASSEVRRVQLLIRQARLERDKIRLDLYAALKGLSIQIGEFKKIVEINSSQILSARARTKEELKRYNQGRGDLTFVIQSQDSEERATLNHANNSARYHSLILELRALSDDLIDDKRIKDATKGRP
jgi:outer membrane protein TolC